MRAVAKRGSLTLAILAMAALALIGCGDDGDAETTPAVTPKVRSGPDAKGQCRAAAAAIASGLGIFDEVPGLIERSEASEGARATALARVKDVLGRWADEVHAVGSKVDDPTLKEALRDMTVGIEQANGRVGAFGDLRQVDRIFESDELELANTKFRAICKP